MGSRMRERFTRSRHSPVATHSIERFDVQGAKSAFAHVEQRSLKRLLQQ